MATFKKTLVCELTKKEWRARAGAAAKNHRKLVELQDKHKIEKKAMKHAEESLDEQIRAALDAVRTGEEERSVDCEVRPDLKTDEMFTVRLDTGEEIERRPMTELEVKRHHQTEMELGGEEMTEEEATQVAVEPPSVDDPPVPAP